MPLPWQPEAALGGCSRDECLDRCNAYCDASLCPLKWRSTSDLHFSTAEYSLLKWTTICSGVLSVLSSGFILLSFRLLPPTHRQPALRIVFWLSVADLLSSLTYVIDGILPTATLGASECRDSGCHLLAISAQFFGLAAVLWSGFVALNLYLFAISTHRLPREQPARYLDCLHLGAWLPSLISVLVLLATDALGPAGLWCWIRPSATWARFIFYEVPVLCSTLASVVLYVKVRSKLRFVRALGERSFGERSFGERSLSGCSVGGSGTPAGGTPAGPAESTQQIASALPALNDRFRAFAIVFTLVHGFRIANRWREDLFGLEKSLSLSLLHAFFGPLQGLGNVFVYGWSPRIRRAYAEAFPQMCARFAPMPRGSETEFSSSIQSVAVIGAESSPEVIEDRNAPTSHLEGGENDQTRSRSLAAADSNVGNSPGVTSTESISIEYK